MYSSDVKFMKNGFRLVFRDRTHNNIDSKVRCALILFHFDFVGMEIDTFYKQGWIVILLTETVRDKQLCIL